MSLIIKDLLLNENAANRPGRFMKPVYITIHETGNTSKGANANAHARYMRSKDAIKAGVSWHYTVDDKEVYRHIPEDETAWHAGDGGGKGNTSSIGIEICVNADGDFAKAKRNAAELVSEILMRRPSLTIVQHNHWNGKNCPQNLRRTGWKEFHDSCIDIYVRKLTDGLRAKGLLNSPDYWNNVLTGRTAVNLMYLREFFSNMVKS